MIGTTTMMSRDLQAYWSRRLIGPYYYDRSQAFHATAEYKTMEAEAIRLNNGKRLTDKRTRGGKYYAKTYDKLWKPFRKQYDKEHGGEPKDFVLYEPGSSKTIMFTRYAPL